MIHKVLEMMPLTEQTYRLRCDRQGLQFFTGQCANVGVPKAGINREYSLYSGENEPYLDFLIREVPGGIISVALKKLKVGDDLEIHGAYGEFRLRPAEAQAKKFLFISTGTGIAPFHSFVKTYPGLDYRVWHGVRRADEGYDKKDYASERHVLCVSQGGGGDFAGRVTSYLKQHPVENDTIVYLCGNRAMINEAYEMLRSQKCAADRIFTEVFF